MLSPPIPIERLLSAYMDEVRRNGEWAVTNVGCAGSDTHEIMYEIIDSGVRAGIVLPAHREIAGWPGDYLMDQAYEAARLAIFICKLEGVTPEEYP
jgi:hypothetical protein